MSQAALVPKLRFSEFSDDWEEKRFVDITTKISDGIHSTPNYDEGGTYSFVNGNNLVNGVIKINSQTKKVDENEYTTHQRPLGSNTILISINGTIGNLALYNNEKVVLGKSACYLNINEKDTDKLYVFNLLRTCKIKRFFNSELTGSTIKNLSLTTIKNTKLNLPTKPEQQKIAAFLTAVDNKIEQLSKKQALLGSWKKGLMQQIFSQAIRFKADDGSAFPVWEEKNIVELAKTSIGLVTSMTPYYVDKGVPLIRNNDIFQNKIRKEKLIRLDYEFDQLNKNRRLFTNDIVTVHTGNIGASAVIDEELNGCQGFATLNTRIKNQNEISSSFLCWYYNSTRNIKYALSMATGDGRSNYNLKDFNKATIPVPSLPEQTKIAAFLTAADNKIEQVGKQFDESKQFKKALLQQMFV